MKKKIRILNIITRLSIGGVSKHVFILTRLFNEDPYRSIIVSGRCEDHEKDLFAQAREYELEVIYVPEMERSINPFKDLISVFKLYRIIKQLAPDVVHTHTAKAGVAGRIAAKLAGVKTIIHTFHGNNFQGYFGFLMSQVSINTERLLALFSRGIIAISAQQKDELIKYKICPERKIKLIPLGFDFEEFTHRESDIGSFKQRYNIPPENKLVGFVGRLTAIKNPDAFIDIAAKVLKHRQDVTFAFVGDGDLTLHLKREVAQRGLKDRVIFTGYLTDLNPLYADLDATILTSTNEGTPVVIIEAMVNRVLVLSTSVGGVPNMIEDGVSGYLFDGVDIDGYAQRLLHTFDHPEEVQPLLDRAGADVVIKYGAERLRQDFVKLFKELGVK